MPTAEDYVKIARNAFNSSKTKSIRFREHQLKLLRKMYEENVHAMAEALAKDLGKPKQECYLYEINAIKNDLDEVIANFKTWVKPERRSPKLIFYFDSPLIYSEPYGVVLVIGHWNYPFRNIPAAIAAGNCLILKPSSLAPATSAFLQETLPRYLDQQCYQVYASGTEELLRERFDLVSFVGEKNRGKIISEAAAKFLTPTNLVLHAKNPVYLDESTNMDFAVGRILKCLNARQSGGGPEYLLCTKEVQDKFVKAAAKIFYDSYKNNPKSCRIISDSNFDKVVEHLTTNKIAVGGKFDASNRYVEPTVLIDVNFNDRMMDEQIFGPVLPIINIKNLREAITFINAREKPLAIYVFSTKNEDVDVILSSTSSGSVIVNDAVPHMGTGNGKTTFDTYVHKKSVLKRPHSVILDKIESIRYPPHSATKRRLLLFLLAKRRSISCEFLPHFVVFLLGVICTMLCLYLFLE